jgi:hypothetical protein
MKTLALSFFLFLALGSFGQSATYKALLALNHNVDNNSYNLKSKLTNDAFTTKKSLIWSNVYFKYYKSNNIDVPDGAMRFAIMNEQTYQIFCQEVQPITLNIFKGKDDKVYDVVVFMYTLENGKVSSEKLKSKSFNITKNDGDVKIEIPKEVVKAGSFLKINTEIISFDFKKLGPFNFSKPTTGDYDLIMSANLPDAFGYSIPDELKEKEKLVKSFNLKEFTYATPPIIDYPMGSLSYKWDIKENKASDVVFKNYSISYSKNVGITAKKLMESAEH